MSVSVHIVKPAAESANYTPSAYREALRKIGVVVSFTKGVSMRPLIWTGRHYVAIVPVEGEPKIGDMLLFEQMRRGETACILHRLIAVERDCHAPEAARNDVNPGHSESDRRDDVGISHNDENIIYITRGDNCLGVERIRREDIIGKVAVIYRASGWRPWFALGGKEIHMTDKSYLRYVESWNVLWPLRRALFRLRAWVTTNRCTRAVLRPIYRLLKKIFGR